MKHTFITRILCALFAYKVIENCDHDPYLVRWYVLRTPWVSLFVHKFIRSDEDRCLHSHPWCFLVVPIWRGYIEHSDRDSWRSPVGDNDPTKREVKRRVWPIIGTRYRPATFRHRVELLPKRSICEQCIPAWNEFERDNPLVTPQDMLNVSRYCRVCHGTAMMTTLKPAWSLFFHFRREREWGFHPPEGFVHWRDWWTRNCE